MTRSANGHAASVHISIRATEAEKERYDALGGVAWFREALNAAPVPSYASKALSVARTQAYLDAHLGPEPPQRHIYWDAYARARRKLIAEVRQNPSLLDAPLPVGRPKQTYTPSKGEFDVSFTNMMARAAVRYVENYTGRLEAPVTDEDDDV